MVSPKPEAALVICSCTSIAGASEAKPAYWMEDNNNTPMDSGKYRRSWSLSAAKAELGCTITW